MLAALVANKRFHLYLLLVYAFFIYLCCVISIQHDDDEDLRAVSDQKLAVRNIRLREIAVITAWPNYISSSQTEHNSPLQALSSHV